MKFIAILLFSLLLIPSCTENPPLETVEQVDLNRYMGQWYEIAKLPNRFEKGLVCVTANYQLREDGKVTVTNKGHLENNTTEIKTAEGVAVLPDKTIPGRLKVSFFRPFYGNYCIIALDSNYQYSLVGDPSRDYLWILSRTRSLEPETYNELIEIAKTKGFNINAIIKTEQECEE